MVKRILVSAVLLGLALSGHEFGQTSNATLGGTVSDRTNALIPGVTVTATNTETGIVSTFVTNETGAYQFASLQPGTYKVTAGLPGFQTRVVNDVRLALSQQARLNIILQVSAVSTAVEVSASADTLLTSSSSVGTVLPEYKVRDLPLASRDVLDLVATTAGVVGDNFAGAREGQVATTVNGIGVNDGRYQTGVMSATRLSPDLVDEVRVLVSPADAETGRGSGQVQVSTRSGTNAFRGSLFHTNRNSALDANTWFNNFNGTKTDYLNRNQFGGRLGGPIIKNKTFFFFLYDGQRVISRTNVTPTVLTSEARQGIFRYFPGTQNANILQTNPTVDALGNPVRPAAATGNLQSVSLFGRDPFRTGLDPAGYIQKQLALMPLPNNYTVGDGLNTAGFRFARRDVGTETPFTEGVDVSRDQLNLRFDHNFNAGNKVFFTMTREHVWASSQQASWPGGLSGETIRHPRVYTSSFVSTLTPAMINEFRFGLRRGSHNGYAAYDRPNGYGKDALENILPKVNGFPFIPEPGVFTPVTYTVGSRVQFAPLYTWADTLSWTRGKHAFKGGVEIRFGSSTAQQGDRGVPRVAGGAGGVAVQGIDPNSTAFPGMAANDATTARNILTALAFSVANIRQSFFLNDSRSAKFLSYEELQTADGVPPGKIRSVHQREMSGFFKDDWKVRPSLTLNLGMRYEYYGVPWEKHGLFASPVGNGAGLFGISGTSFDDLFQPGRLAGSPTVLELAGKNSPNPGEQIYKDDYNNFAPAVGLSWSLPWLGKDKTVLRAGYGISYQGGGNTIKYDYSVNSAPGLNDDVTFTSSGYLNLANIQLPLTRGVPLQPIGFEDRTKGIEAFDNNLVSPYIQNWNLEIQRTLAQNLLLSVRYVGSKGTKLFADVPLNEVNIFENGILEAFNITRAGGNASLFDKMLMGVNVTGAGVVNGTTLTGSQAFRQSTATRGLIANGDVGAFAAYLNNTTNFTNRAGGIPRNGGFPENFITANPQFNTENPGGTTTPGNATLIWNNANSTYHSMQLDLSKRLSSGFTTQTSYTWSRSIGESDTDGSLRYLTLRDRSLNKSLLGFHRTHAIISSGTYSLPFGPSRALLGDAPGFVARFVENWQLGGIFRWISGAPLTVTGGRSSFNSGTAESAAIVGDFPHNIGKPTVTNLPGVVTLFPGFQQAVDPARAGVTTLQATQASFSAMAVTDAQGKLLLINPVPGQHGTLGLRTVEGPSALGLDMNVVKRVRIAENKNFELRVDVINILNTPQWSNPAAANLNINSAGFGRITSTRDGTNRMFIINTRLNF